MMHRNRITTGALIGLALLVCVPAAVGADVDIRLNSLGFLPDMPKRASVAADCTDFRVCRKADSKAVYSGKAARPVRQEDVAQAVAVIDFSAVREPGIYYLDVPGVGRSIDFPIDGDVYADAFKTVMRGFYLWRCGCAVEGEHNGITYAHGPCHLEDGWLDYAGSLNTRRDGTKGWHDAGDYGKYTVNAGVTLGVLFLAWDQYKDRLEGLSLDLPDTAPKFPDFLEELKWETDWLLTMQLPDGSGKVSHKLTRLNFSGFIMPEKDKEKRYFTEWGSAATADFVAMMAMAARYFKPYDPEYAQTCLDAARQSYAFLLDHPDDKRPDQGAFSTGGYGTSDRDDRLWAAAELWQTTGEDRCLKDFEARARSTRRPIEANWDWGSVGNLGTITYLESKREGRDPELVKKIKAALLTTADEIAAQAKADVYGRPLGGRYYWGCNGTVARQTVLLMTAHRIAPKDEYVHAALSAVDHLFGRNVYNRSYVTGVGHRPPLYPHDRRSGADGIEAPWPGYLVGGGHSATGWNDVEEDYRTNEIAINWQAALVYAMAGFIEPPTK